ncbi:MULTISPECIES: complex I NDUFA9 subunit family protein [Halorubrum]|uniref:NAD-dependent epimerase/dehydratase n=1 Tax=Halorubrum hochstenium ATCC 700873 TaxID=1227481 RepID=M0FBK9_9EURY|nr:MULTISPECIES: complex I NDUFA9 subunit family protein [Halorubrum]ELZ57401.1 NAD-dependent epimerase/dehydratase [Halorubrum hochstenium ATCC 700873]
MKVLVAGGTGFIGSYLCRALAEDGHAVTALSRSPEETPEGVTGVSGDVTDHGSIESAVEGHDAVVNLVALSPLFEPEGGNRMHDRIHRGGTENLVRAAEDGGVERFVQLSALGADPNGDTAYIRAKGEAEAIVRESDLDWAIFRPSVVFGEGGEFVSFTKRLKGMFAPGVPLYPLPGGGKTRFQPIHVEDLVPMIAAAVTEEEHAGETYEIGGPEVLTLRQVTDLVYEAERKGVTILPLPMPLAKIGLSVLGAVPGFPMGPDQYRSLKFDNTTADNDVAAFGVDAAELTTLGEHLGVR